MVWALFDKKEKRVNQNIIKVKADKIPEKVNKAQLIYNFHQINVYKLNILLQVQCD
jgi:hypothetical protein